MGTAEPTISVIIVTYNHERYISECIQSVIVQWLPEDCTMEVLVGDDASTDGTAELAKSFEREHPGIVKVIARPKNLGATANFSDLIRRARGRFIALCEGDDCWCSENKLAKQLDVLDRHPEYSACTHDCRIIDENSEVTLNENPSWVTTKPVFTQDDVDGYTMPGHTSTLFLRNIPQFREERYLNVITLDPLISDRAVGMLFASFGGIYHIPETMSSYRKIYRKGASNASSVRFASNDDKDWDDYLYTKKLQSYMRDELDINVDFSPHIKELVQLMFFKSVKTMKPHHWKNLATMCRRERLIPSIKYITVGIGAKLRQKLQRS